jgi:hypothetical protein
LFQNTHVSLLIFAFKGGGGEVGGKGGGKKRRRRRKKNSGKGTATYQSNF